MKVAATIPEETSVGHLVGQRVLEGVLEIGEEAALVENSAAWSRARLARSSSSDSSAIETSSAAGTSLPITDGGLQQMLVPLGRDDRCARRASETAPRADLDRRDRDATAGSAPRAPVSASVSTSVRTLSSRNSGFRPSAPARVLRAVRDRASSPEERASGASTTLSGISGSSRSCV